MFVARSEYLAGFKAELPILLGDIPFGIIYGALAVDAGLSSTQAQGMSLIVFAGSAQFIMTQLFSLHTPALIIVATAFMVNLRHALYSGSVSPYVNNLPKHWRYILAYFLTDEAYAVTITHYREPDKFTNQMAFKHWYFLGSGMALWLLWQISTAIGIFLGPLLPDSWPLAFFVPLSFIALMVPTLKDLPSLIASITGGLVAILAFGLPLRLGIIVAALLGIGAGLFSENWIPESTSTKMEKDVN